MAKKPYPPLAVPSWGIGVMFAGFLVFTFLWEKMMHAIKHRLQHKNQRGLLEVIAKLEEELLAMGLISLLLPFIEGYIMMICVPARWAVAAPGYNDQGWASDGHKADYSTKKEAAYEAYQGAKGSGEDGYGSEGKGRHLLAAASPTMEQAGKCDDGDIKLFPTEAIHGIHIFIALTAIVHIMYACISMALCMWRVHKWRKWEAEGRSNPLIVMSSSVMHSIGRSSWTHAAMAVIRQFTMTVSKPMYLGLRYLLLQTLKERANLSELPNEYPFYQFVREQMELSFCQVIGISPLIWLFALIQLMVPVTARVYSVIGICSACIIIQVAAGAKLWSAAVHLAARAHLTYGVDSIESRAKALLPNAALSLPATPDAHHRSHGLDQVPSWKQLRQQYRSRPSQDPEAPSPAATAANEPSGAPAPPPARHGRSLMGFFCAGKAADRGTSNGVSGGIKLAAAKPQPADVVGRYKGVSDRVVMSEEFADLFWFKRPQLLLWIYKIAYFQSAFCLTLMFFAVWKDNQFLPEKTQKAQLAGFAVVLAVNVILSLFQSAVVMPIYSLVTHAADDKAVADACKFLERDVRHEEHLQLARSSSIAEEADELIKGLAAVLQKMHSTAGHLQNESFKQQSSMK